MARQPRVDQRVTPLSDPRRNALRWLSRQLAWERTLARLRKTPERAAA